MVTLPALLTHLAFACGLALLSAGLVRAMISARILDRPNHRSAHTTPTPKGGGVGIVGAFLAGSVVLFFTANFARLAEPYFSGFILGAIAIALVSMLDDIRDFRFTVKLAAQAAAALVVMLPGLRIDSVFLPGIGPVALGLFAWPVTLIWIVGLTNAVNFMDGLDGLVGGVALIGCAFLAVAAEASGGSFVYFAALMLCAGVAGFLPFNLHPARIFMGDVGSQFIGYVLAVLGVAASRFDTAAVSFWIVPILLFGLVFDVTFTLLRRALAGEPLAAAHRGHLYQVLARSGFGVWRVTLLQWGLAILHGFAALWFLRLAPFGKLGLVAALIAVQLTLLWFVSVKARASRIDRW